jgi:hypothetical protein
MLSQDHSDKLQQQLSQLNKSTQLEADYAQLQVTFCCCFTVALLLLYCCQLSEMTQLEADYAQLQVIFCCFNAALMLLYCCFTATLLLPAQQDDTALGALG